MLFSGRAAKLLLVLLLIITTGIGYGDQNKKAERRNRYHGLDIIVYGHGNFYAMDDEYIKFIREKPLSVMSFEYWEKAEKLINKRFGGFSRGLSLSGVSYPLNLFHIDPSKGFNYSLVDNRIAFTYVESGNYFAEHGTRYTSGDSISWNPIPMSEKETVMALERSRYYFYGLKGILSKDFNSNRHRSPIVTANKRIEVNRWYRRKSKKMLVLYGTTHLNNIMKTMAYSNKDVFENYYAPKLALINVRYHPNETSTNTPELCKYVSDVASPRVNGCKHFYRSNTTADVPLGLPRPVGKADEYWKMELNSLYTIEEIADDIVRQNVTLATFMDVSTVYDGSYKQFILQDFDHVTYCLWAPCPKHDLERSLPMSPFIDVLIGQKNLLEKEENSLRVDINRSYPELEHIPYSKYSLLAALIKRGHAPIIANTYEKTPKGESYADKFSFYPLLSSQSHTVSKSYSRGKETLQYLNEIKKIMTDDVALSTIYSFPSDDVYTPNHQIIKSQAYGFMYTLVADEIMVGSDDYFQSVEILHGASPHMTLGTDRAHDIAVQRATYDPRYHVTDENLVSYMKTGRIAPLNIAPIHRMSRLDEEDTLYMKYFDPVYSRYPLFTHIYKHTSPKTEDIFAASDAFFYAREYGKGLFLHSDDALDRILEYIAAAYYRIGAYAHLKSSSHSEINRKNTPITPQSGKIQATGLTYMDPLIIVPYYMVKGTRSLFRPRQTNDCPYFGIVLGAYYLGNFGDLSHSSVDSSVYFSPRLLLSGEVCIPGTKKPIRMCSDINNDIYSSYSSALYNKKHLTIINLEDYRRTDTVFDRLSSLHAGLHEHKRSLTLPYLLQPLNYLGPYSHSCEEEDVNYRSLCSKNLDSVYSLDFTTPLLPPPSINLESVPEHFHKYYLKKSLPPSPPKKESIRSWRFGRNYTLDGIYNRRTRLVGTRYYGTVPTEDDADVIEKVSENYKNFINDMLLRTNLTKVVLDTEKIAACPYVHKDDAKWYKSIDLIN